MLFVTMKKKALLGIGIVVVLIIAYSLLSSFLGRSRFSVSEPFGYRSSNEEPLSAPAPMGMVKTFRETGMPDEEYQETEAPGMGSPGETALEEGSLSQRLVIKTGVLSLLVKNTLEAVKSVQSLAENLGGFVLSSRTWYLDEKQERMKGEVTLKVPVDQFSEALNQLKNLALKVASEQTSGRDVTEEYTDLESRLRNLEATEAQLLEIMKKAVEIPDVLSVQRELTTVRSQIEQLKGRMKFLRESAQMSTITVTIATEEEELPVVEEKWRPLKVAKDALRSLVSFWQNISNMVIWSAIFFAPFMVLFLIYKFIRKLRRKPPVAS